MRKLILVATATLAIFMSACQLDPGTNFQNSSDSLLEFRSGFIVVEDDVDLLADTGSPSVTIDRIDILDLSDNLVASYTGCGLQSCYIDLSALSPGRYKAEVFTSNGGSFSDFIDLG